MYVTRCFWVDKKFLVTFAIFAKFEALVGLEFVKSVILAIFEVFVAWCF